MNGKGWMLAIGVLALAVIDGAAISGAAAQEAEERGLFNRRAEATLYRDPNFNGPAVTATEARSNLALSWRVGSVRVRSGRWELCEKSRYRGTCRIVDRSTPMLGAAFKGMKVQSMRPIGGSGGREPGKNPTLRGMAAQFYSAPARSGYRVLACPSGNATASCAARSAEQFCSAMGWRRAARQAMETVRGRVYLADVLCSNTGT